MKLEVNTFKGDQVVEVKYQDYATASLACDAFDRIEKYSIEHGKNILLILRNKKDGSMILNRRICPAESKDVQPQ